MRKLTRRMGWNVVAGVVLAVAYSAFSVALAAQFSAWWLLLHLPAALSVNQAMECYRMWREWQRDDEELGS
jgi:hypothetical protein